MAQIHNNSVTCDAEKPELTQDRLKELLHYDPETGLFTRRTSTGGKHAGSVCGAPQNRGYIQVMVAKVNYLAHRLAWFYVNGVWPENDVDHIDGVRTNNQWKNLRSATRSFNLQNMHKSHVDSVTGFLGCTYDKSRNKYSASIFTDGKRKHLGRFASAIEAHEAYLKVKRQIHDGCTI